MQWLTLLKLECRLVGSWRKLGDKKLGCIMAATGLRWGWVSWSHISIWKCLYSAYNTTEKQINLANHHHITPDHEQALLLLLIIKVPAAGMLNAKQNCSWLNYSQRHTKIRPHKFFHVWTSKGFKQKHCWKGTTQATCRRQNFRALQNHQVIAGIFGTGLAEASEKDTSS